MIAHAYGIMDDLTLVYPVAPAIESTILLIPALLLIRLALWTTMTVNTINIITLGLVIAWGHAGDFAEILLLPCIKLVIMVMTAIEIRACVRPLQIEDIAKLKLLDSLDFLAGNGGVKFVNSLSKSISINSRD